MIDSSLRYLVLGAGVTGQSVVRYLHANGCDCSVADQMLSLSTEQIEREPLLADVPFFGGEFTEARLREFDCLVVSPGIAVRSAAIQAAGRSGVEIVGDVELFARQTTRPVLAVTGSNGKSTVVSLIDSILRAAGKSVSLVGNLGKPCLDAIDEDSDVVVIELSSFQLETLASLKPLAATVLNISADHLDRYDDLADYAAAKRRIYNNATHCLYNADDTLTHPIDAAGQRHAFSMSHRDAEWFVDDSQSPSRLLSVTGNTIDVRGMKISGRHNIANALVAAAMSSYFIDDDSAIERGLGEFAGLPHRMRLVCSTGGVKWYNDSKGTNAGAAISAIEGMDGPVILIAGGRGKNADYQQLANAIAASCRAVLLIGEEAQAIASVVGNRVPLHYCDSMAEAVTRAAQIAVDGDRVLLSPACSSFDMFRNFEVRGEVFEQEVQRQCA
jgi:UDP-N-acetylmuramoylalanine--D-glutamate ligase